MKHLIYKYLFVVLLGILLLTGCNKQEEKTAEVQHEDEVNVAEFSDDQLAMAGIKLGGVQHKVISGTIKVNGVLDVPPQQKVSVSIPFGGFLKSTSMLQGSRVSKGDLIAVIENTEYIQLQQDYLEALTQFEFSKADYERQQQLSSENVNSTKTLQQSKATYQSWLAKKNGLLAKLRLLNIDLDKLSGGDITSTANVYSSISGYVTQVNVNIGKFVNPADVLFEIVDTEHLHAELIVFERDVPKIKIGQKVRFTLTNENKERFATVYLIGREIGSDRTIRIHCHIDKEDTNLLPGMYLKAIVEAGGVEVPALPDGAIVDFKGKKYVFVPNDTATASENEKQNGQLHHFEMVEIQTGSSELGFTEVTFPETKGTAAVVVEGAYAILSKIKNSEEEEGH
ncbi:efflux RND transporter periplasmic adaptor subunit [Chryseolinea sp. T2]|uniref:efflux RND transporter periplasmic adaptor subunit n=1 Tax=Chryseolinea sp. T2 TaxID=3129255 RepID=UPI0030781FD4